MLRTRGFEGSNLYVVTFCNFEISFLAWSGSFTHIKTKYYQLHVCLLTFTLLVTLRQYMLFPWEKYSTCQGVCHKMHTMFPIKGFILAAVAFSVFFAFATPGRLFTT